MTAGPPAGPASAYPTLDTGVDLFERCERCLGSGLDLRQMDRSLVGSRIRGTHHAKLGRDHAHSCGAEELASILVDFVHDFDRI